MIKPSNVVRTTVVARAIRAARQVRIARRCALAGGFLLTACNGPSARGSGYCAPPIVARPFTSDPAPPASASRVERMAALLGLHQAFGRGPSDTATSIEIVERIEEARLAVAGTRAELDCASESARQVAAYLAHAQSITVQALTVGSIAVAAITSIAGVALSTQGAPAGAQDAVAIAGGASAAGLGLGSLYVHRRAYFEHQRNLLADIWIGPQHLIDVSAGCLGLLHAARILQRRALAHSCEDRREMEATARGPRVTTSRW